MNEKYVAINLLSLKGNSSLPIDVYLMLRGKHVHYFRRGDLLDLDRLIKLQEKTQTLYIPEEDSMTYLSLVKKNLKTFFEEKNSPEETTELIAGMFQSLIEYVMTNSFATEPLFLLKSSADELIEYLKIHNEIPVMTLLMNKNPNKYIGRHAFVVACIAIHICQKFNLIPADHLKSLALGALLHDATHENLQVKPLVAMDSIELNKYQDHPRLGYEKFKESKEIDLIAKTVIMQHEELPDGRGYPKKLFINQIDKPAYLVGLANIFDRLYSLEETPSESLIRKITAGQKDLYPQEVLDHLMTLVQ